MTQLDELVSAAKSLDEHAPPPEAGTRMWAKIVTRAGGAAALGMVAATLGTNTASASTAAASSAVASTAATAATSTTAVSAAATTSLAVTVAKVGAALALTAGLGVGVVSVATAPAEPGPVQPQAPVELATSTVQNPGPRPSQVVVPLQREVEVEDEVELLEAEPEPEPVAEELTRPKAGRGHKRLRRPTDRASALGAESALLGKARLANSGGRNRAALSALREHASRYPNGELAEVRRALEVRVLCELGRVGAARKAADRFLSRHKASGLAGQVRASCAYEE
ncbi:MAG: hypothetical protein KUG77_16215 [Nannocystaceae bacterium]|nr:hypothetical protein [Nannocystaceae bacterium]